MAEYLPGMGLNEKCGVVGIFGVPDAAQAMVPPLHALQHRGLEGSSIVAADGETGEFRRIGNGGMVLDIPAEDIALLGGDQALGHTRWGTSGEPGAHHVQPTMWDGISMAENGNQCITAPSRRFLDERDIDHSNLNDSEVSARVVGCLVMDGLELPDAVEKAFPLFTGAFTKVFMEKGRMVALRDRCGIRPGVIGKLGAGFIVASETCALDAAGATLLRDINPGEMVIFTKDGMESRQLAEPDPKFDVMEILYLSRPDSTYQLTEDGPRKSVYEMREALGRQLAEEYPDADIDFVMPIPDTSIPAAIGFAEALKKPYRQYLYRNPFIQRTFILPPALRLAALRMKFNAIRSLIQGKKPGIVDDTIVRGTTQRVLNEEELKAAEPEAIDLYIPAPPILYPDFYGVNTPDQDELIAANLSDKDMARALGVRSVNYLSIDGVCKALGVPRERLCLSAFDGIYPLDIGDNAENIRQIQRL